jgi:hypothetical protein
MDLPYTHKADASAKTAKWDVAWTEDDFNNVLAQIAAVKTGDVNVYIIKCHISDVTWLSANLKGRDYVVHPHVWEKIDQNIFGTHKIVPSCENIIVAISKKLHKKEGYWQQMPVNPIDRHGLLIGPIVRKMMRTTEGANVNRCQSPIYLSNILAQRYFPQGMSTVLNICMGVGSDVIGLASAGLNVIGVDNCKEMYDATTARLVGHIDNEVAAKRKDPVRYSVEGWAKMTSRLDGRGAFGVSGWIALQQQIKDEAEAAAAREAQAAAGVMVPISSSSSSDAEEKSKK